MIPFGIVDNAASIAYAERARDLASLRVIGLTNGEAALVLLGELAVVTLVALPIGAILGDYRRLRLRPVSVPRYTRYPRRSPLKAMVRQRLLSCSRPSRPAGW